MPINNDTNPNPNSTQSNKGNGNNAGGRNHQNNNNNNNGNHNKQNGNSQKQKKPDSSNDFKGIHKSMNGHVFQLPEECNDRGQFKKTMKALGLAIDKSCEVPQFMTPLYKQYKLPVVPRPRQLTEDEKKDDLEVEMWKHEVSDHVRCKQKLQKDLVATHAIIWGQCSDALQNKLEALPDALTKLTEHDCVWLLIEIKSLLFKYAATEDTFVALYKARQAIFTCKQHPNMSDADYLSQFQGLVDVLETYGGATAMQEATRHLPEAVKNDIGSDVPLLKEAARQRTLATAFMMGIDRQRYGTLLKGLQAQCLLNNNQYPTTLSTAYALLLSSKADKTTTTTTKTSTNRYQNNNNNNNNPNTTSAGADKHTISNEGTTFVQDTPSTSQKDEQLNKSGKNNNYTYTTKSSNKSSHADHQLVQCGMMFTQESDNTPSWTIPDTYLLLDSESTASVFNNHIFLKNIRSSDTPLRVQTNGGQQLSTQIGEYANLGTVWYNPTSIANILSLAQVRKKCRVTMDSSKEPALLVHCSTGHVMKFVEGPTGLYYFDAAAPSNQIDWLAPPSSSHFDLFQHHSFVELVDQNKALYHKRDIERANQARQLYRKLGRPGQQTFLRMLQNNEILNCPITPADATRAVCIYGPDVATLQGRSVKQSGASHIPTLTPSTIPDAILDTNRHITLCLDIFYVDKLAYLHSISRKIDFRTVSALISRSKASLLKNIKSILALYSARGFIIADIHADQEFACVRDDILPVRLNIAATDDHVGEVERSIRTIKERVRATIHGLPFKRYPKLMMNGLIAQAVTQLNSFPSQNGVSTTLSPLTIVTGRPKPDYNKLTLEFGTYVHVFEDNDPTNTTKARTTGAITLNATGNAEGDYYFFSLITGRRLTRHQWTPLPMPQAAIVAVEELAQQQGCPLIRGAGPIITLGDDVVLEEPIQQDAPEQLEIINDDESVASETNHHTDDDVDNINIHDHDNHAPNEMVEHEEREEHVNANANEIVENEEREERQDENINIDTANDNENDSNNENPVVEDVEDVEDDNDEEDNEDNQSGQRYNLRGNRSPRYDYRFGFGDTSHTLTQVSATIDKTESITGDMKGFIFGFIMTHMSEKAAFSMTQMSEKAGIKKHGEWALEMLMKEFLQLHDKDVFDPRTYAELTPQQRKRALNAINVFKEKRDGRLKGRTCADGRSQRPYYDKNQTSSPTISTDALMMTLVADAKEGRDVATADVVGAYLNTFLPDFVLLKLTGPSVDIMCRIHSKYKHFVCVINGVRTLYLQLKKGLYGLVQSALLWYELFSSTLEKQGFELNPYDLCVANKMINGKQATVAWYVDDNKISHEDPEVVTNIIELIEEKFGKMTVTRGDKHIFLGMEVTFDRVKNTVHIGTTNYINEAIDESGLEITNDVATPAQRNIFEINTSSPKLSQKEAATFHSVVAKLLYVSTRGRIDIQLTIAFLCTRVTCATVEDQSKLKRLLQYLYGTKELGLTLGADDMSSLSTWVDASYAVHADMRSHTGGVFSFGRGGIMGKSSKQSLNTKSSTEAEVVGASDYLANTIWAANFLRAQGYHIKKNWFGQDNESAMKIEKNGRTSMGKKSRHYAIRFHWLKDRFAQDEISVEHCPTEEMLADFLTKPLQGTMFRNFRDVLLGVTHTSTLKNANLPESVPPVPVERVENQEDQTPVIARSGFLA